MKDLRFQVKDWDWDLWLEMAIFSAKYLRFCFNSGLTHYCIYED